MPAPAHIGKGKQERNNAHHHSGLNAAMRASASRHRILAHSSDACAGDAKGTAVGTLTKESVYGAPLWPPRAPPLTTPAIPAMPEHSTTLC